MRHEIRLGSIRRELQICRLDGGISIAYLDVLGDLELLDAFAEAAREDLRDVDIMLAGDTVGLVVAHHLAQRSGTPYVAARKRRTPNMIEEPLTVPVQSIASARPSAFYLGADKSRALHGKNVCVVDEVMSSGSTINALMSLATMSGCSSVKAVVIATEGVPRDNVRSFIHLPLFPQSSGALCGVIVP